MKVVVVPGPYTPERARAALAAGRAAPPSPKVEGYVVVPDGLPDAPPPGDAPEAIPRIRVERHVRPNGEFLFVGMVKALGRALAGNPVAVALDGAGPAMHYLDEHGARAGELPNAVGRVLFWNPDRPVLLHFCPAPLVAHYAREWMRFVAAQPLQTRDIVNDTPTHRLRFHLAYAARQKALHHPRARAWRKLRVTLPGRALAALGRLWPWR